MRLIILVLCTCLIASCARQLSDGEERFLLKSFGTEIDYSVVRIREGGLPNLFPRAEAVAVENRIFWQDETYREDFIPPDDISYVQDQILLAHEVAHIWQFQNSDITGYSLNKVIAEHRNFGRQVYDYIKPLDLSKPFLEYRYEQQAEIVEDWVCATLLNDPQAFYYEKIIRAAIPSASVEDIIRGSGRRIGSIRQTEDVDVFECPIAPDE